MKDLQSKGTISKYVKDVRISEKVMNGNIEESYDELINNLDNFLNDFWILVVKQFVQDLKLIIQNAPAMKKESVVFRGIKTRYYSLNGGDTFQSSTFLSTSFDPATAIRFSGSGYCCLKKIILPVGTRAIVPEFLTQYSSEKEILLNIDSVFKILDSDMKNVYSESFDKEVTIEKFQKEKACDFEIRTKLVTTMKLII